MSEEERASTPELSDHQNESDLSDLSDVDEDNYEAPEFDIDLIGKHKRAEDDSAKDSEGSKKLKKRRKDVAAEPVADDIPTIEEEDEGVRKRREFEERFAKSITKKPSKRRAGEVDLEQMQDEAIAHLKILMREAAYNDSENVKAGKPSTEKLLLLPQVRDTLMRANLSDSILDNNMLESVRLWLEPLPDGSLPAYEIQKSMFQAVQQLPIKTIHLRESGLGKVVLFYQKSKKVDPSLKRAAEKMIGDWTRPIMGRSDNYKDKNVASAEFDYTKFINAIPSAEKTKKVLDGRKSLYEESAARRNRAAAPAARTSAYTIAPKMNNDVIQRRKEAVNSSREGKFKNINSRMNLLTHRRGTTKKGGVSIQGNGLD
ncbi:unnamed protein product [Kuraishia capsulata CBS 1993]|uniref:TFIIS N-terminal domain-containing protein n=1 Tax=Kuraishia capsulata CBS 1993 TaxID=1382522 RepID=W6MGT3_9ASCO|nr:uncharacterized protein KUCA_T00001033001 [Kuraishia capsulata CBS 1993]CDK25066.1 unnamed protein product [Kuraishia capsulata CBS 1993]